MEIQSIPLNCLDSSKTNPRKTFDKDRLEQLGESIREAGVQQPIVVRKNGSPDRFEIVAGERRYRACRLIGLEEIPAWVRELDDKQVLRIQLIENVQREDLDPIEEANGYKLLCEHHGYTAQTLAKEIGKSRNYVYARLKLTELTRESQAIVQKGEASASVAELVARIPNKTEQKKAADRLLRPDVTVERGREIVSREFMVQLKGCPFGASDASLVKAAGACTKCPKREKGNVCTDPPCYQKKLAAHWKRKARELLKAGVVVALSKDATKLPKDATPEQRRKVSFFNSYGSCCEPRGWICLTDCNWSGPKGRTSWGSLLTSKPIEELCVRERGAARLERGYNGHPPGLKFFIPATRAKELLEERHEWARTQANKAIGERKATREKNKKVRLETAVNEEALKGILEKASLVSWLSDLKVLPLLTRRLLGFVHSDQLVRMAKRRGHDKVTGYDFASKLKEEIEKGEMGVREFNSLFLEILLDGLAALDYDKKRRPEFEVLCRHAGVSLAAIERFPPASKKSSTGSKEKPK